MLMMSDIQRKNTIFGTLCAEHNNSAGAELTHAALWDRDDTKDEFSPFISRNMHEHYPPALIISYLSCSMKFPSGLINTVSV